MKERALFLAVKLVIKNCPAEKIGPLTPSDIARKFGVSISYLSRSFSNHNYFTLHGYLELYKFIQFQTVAARLKKPTVKEVLALMNIQNTSYFIRRYKMRLGDTPGQYCKEQRDRRKEWWKKRKKWEKEYAKKKGQK